MTKRCLHDLAPLPPPPTPPPPCHGTVPSGLKQVIVTPIPKKLGLDANDLRNFILVSNLPFVSKILERVVLQLQSPLCANSLLETIQSAYRKYHSTKTAVLSVLEGLLTKYDQKPVSVLALLDLSAAFDILDHAILLRRHESTFGISWVALCWFESYLSDKTYAVCYGWRCEIHTNTPCPWCSSGIGHRTCTIHPVLTTPVWCQIMSHLWLSQVRWWDRNLWQCTA